MGDMIEVLRQLYEGPLMWIITGLVIGGCIVAWHDQRKQPPR